MRVRKIIVIALSFCAAIAGFLSVCSMIPGIIVQNNFGVFVGGYEVLAVHAVDQGFYATSVLPGSFWPKGIIRGGETSNFAVRMSSPSHGGGLQLSLTAPWWALFLLLVIYPAWVFHHTRRGKLIERRRVEHNECIHCGYSRQGNTSGVCPECGKSLESVTTSA